MAILTIVSGVAGVLVVAAAATMLLPRHVHVERQATMDSKADDILTLAASNTGYQEFNPYHAADPDLQITHFGPATGVGSGFHFDGKDGKGSQTVANISPDSVSYAIDMGAMGQPKQTITVTPVGNGNLVTWSMDADMGMNPIARVIGRFMDGMMGKTLEAGLKNLESAT